MFGQIRMIFTLIIIMGIAGAGMYVFKLRADNATLKANQLQLETAITEQNKVLEQQKEDFEAILESNKKLNVLIQTFKKDLQDLDKRFTKKNRDVGKLAIDRTKAVERIINKGAKNAARCLELASGAEHTEDELKATKKSEILRGEGESEAILIYANAFEKDSDFYSFYRSMQAYGNVLGEEGTTMILSPDSEFLEFFNNSKGLKKQ